MKKNDTVDIIRRVDANWYEATKEGRVGIIPVSYVQVGYVSGRAGLSGWTLNKND